MLELTVVLVYFVAMLAIGAIRLKVRGLDGFFVMGRRGSVLFITGSMVTAVAERIMKQPITFNLTCPHCGKNIKIAIIGSEKPTG